MAQSFNDNPGAIGLPKNTKEGGKRVDFKSLNDVGDTDFDFLISTKTPRFAWSRATQCPCVGQHNEDATAQPDPNCRHCNGLGWTYSRPVGYEEPTDTIGTLTDVQRSLIDRTDAMVIRALLTSASSEPDIFAALGEVALGTGMMTTRPANRLGYYDRLVAIDDEMVFSEVVRTDGSGGTKLHYPAKVLNTVLSIDPATGDKVQYDATDVCIDAAGNLEWLTGKEPGAGTQVSVNYVCMPVFVMMTTDKITRTAITKFKKENLQTPQGDTQLLPHRYMVRLSHLTLETEPS